MRSQHQSSVFLSVLIAALAMMALSLPASAQVCSYGGGGGSGTGGGGATLKTITLDANPSDWTDVLANPLQTTIDGEFINPCGTSSVLDLDCSIGGYKNVSGRDLAKFAWTYDTTNIYLFLRRYGSTSNQQTFLFYADTNQNQRMNTGEYVLKVTFSGTNQRLDSTLWTYTVHVPGGGLPDQYGDAIGDYLAAGGTGYADGFTPWGTLSGSVDIDSNQSWCWSDGTGSRPAFPGRASA